MAGYLERWLGCFPATEKLRPAFAPALIALMTSSPAIANGSAPPPTTAPVAFERAAVRGVALDATWDLRGSPSRLVIRVQNARPNDVYVFDTLWALDKASQIVADPQGLYRFIAHNKLLLILGAAPLPRTPVAYSNVPFATLVKSGQTLEKAVEIALPVTEYSVYFRGRESAERAQAIREVQLRVQIVDAKPGFRIDKVPFDTTAVKLSVPGIVSHAEWITSKAPVQFQGLARTDNFERPDF